MFLRAEISYLKILRYIREFSGIQAEGQAKT